MKTLPVLPLESVRIASPCSVPWSSMEGDDRRRHCRQCDRAVYDLSSLSRDEAEALVGARAATGERLCVSFFVRQDGTVLTADCPVGLARVRRSLRRVGALLGALLGSVAGLLGCTPPAEVMGAPAPRTQVPTDPGEPEPAPRELMGDMYEPPAHVQSTTVGEVAPAEASPAR